MEDARFGRNGRLLFAGRSDGGNSPFYCGLRNDSRVTPMGVIDGYTTPYDMQSQAITNMLQLEAASGEVIVGQVKLVRVGPRGGGNTLLTLAAQTDGAGVLYELQSAAPLRRPLPLPPRLLAALPPLPLPQAPPRPLSLPPPPKPRIGGGPPRGAPALPQ